MVVTVMPVLVDTSDRCAIRCSSATLQAIRYFTAYDDQPLGKGEEAMTAILPAAVADPASRGSEITK
jgi:hypothetical protein